MLEKLELLYGNEKAPKILEEINNIIKNHKAKLDSNKEYKKYELSEKDVVVITYGDQIKEEGKTPLKTFHEFIKEYTKGRVSGIHILPFHPYTSDDGFSVVDFEQIDPNLGDWDDINDIAEDFNLMADLVVNHISQEHKWFKGFLNEEPEYDNFFIERPKDYDYRSVTRPRPWPLINEYKTKTGKSKFIWTTFSTDQIDLNFKNEKVLLSMIEFLLNYTLNGAKLIRMDAIGYVWKEDGTSCINLEQAHKIVQLFRDILEKAAPQTIIITETNVPHKDNISYWGDGTNEAHMVYNFSLPPLTLQAFQTGNAKHLLRWAKSLENEFVSDEATFFNFMASHDGIGILPTKGILSEKEKQEMINTVKKHGGNVSVKSDGDGNKSPYEMNINYLDGLSSPDDPDELRIKRFVASQSILLAMKGVPGVYIHSLLGSTNYYEKLDVSDQFTYRSINREKFMLEDLKAKLNDLSTMQNKVFNQYLNLLDIRINQKAFNPKADQKVILLNDKVFSLLRSCKSSAESIITLANVSNEIQNVDIAFDDLGLEPLNSVLELISNKDEIINGNCIKIELQPYEVKWLKV